MLSYFPELMVTSQLIRDNTGGTYVEGIYVAPAKDTTDLQMIAPQPIRENDLNMLADGERASDYRVTWVFADTDLHTRTKQHEADIITYDGKIYKVMQVNERDPIGNFRKVFIRDIEGV